MNRSYGAPRTSSTYFDQRLRALLQCGDVTRVCDLGGGANPIVSLDTVRSRKLAYLVVDVSETELAKAPGGYRTHTADVGIPQRLPDGPYDLILSKWVAEHIASPQVFHRNVLEALRPGGFALHLFPTLYSLPFVLNRLVPTALSERALGALRPGREAEGTHAKFKTYYRWCRGPTRRQETRLRALGYEVAEYVGFFGTNYFEKLPWLDHAEGTVSHHLTRHPAPLLTSFACVLLRKPAGAGDLPGAGAPGAETGVLR